MYDDIRVGRKRTQVDIKERQQRGVVKSNCRQPTCNGRHMAGRFLIDIKALVALHLDWFNPKYTMTIIAI